MFYVWNVFGYEKSINLENDNLSSCGVRIDTLNQPIFKDEPKNKVCIYSSAARSIELMINREIFQIRLFLWEETRTISIILEKFDMKNVFIELKDKKLIFNQFILTFYKIEDLEEFQNTWELKIENRFKSQNKIEQPFYKTEFITKINKLTSKRLNFNYKIEIHSKMQFLRCLNGLIEQ
jgi:hypothetical protein